MSTFAPLASSSLEDISTQRCQLSPTTTLTFKALDVQFEALEIQYAMFPPSKKRGLLAAGPRVSVGGAPLDDPEDEEPARGAGAH